MLPDELQSLSGYAFSHTLYIYQYLPTYALRFVFVCITCFACRDNRDCRFGEFCLLLLLFVSYLL